MHGLELLLNNRQLMILYEFFSHFILFTSVTVSTRMQVPVLRQGMQYLKYKPKGLALRTCIDPNPMKKKRLGFRE
ncbi:MAG: hypothetical protein LPK03_13860, partial [Pontibacter sp.]|nr:hypothetical protein [Pontibacter sp.]